MARRSTAVAVLGLAALGVASPASAAWLVSGSGAATASATALTATGKPTATQAMTSQDVSVSWTTVNPAPTRYSVVRKHTTTGATTSVECPSSPCLDPAVPTGSYTYTVTPRLGMHWSGGTSAASEAITVVARDTTGPTIGLDCPQDNREYTKNGNATGSWTRDCGQQIKVNVADPSGVGSVRVSVRQGTTNLYLTQSGTFATSTSEVFVNLRLGSVAGQYVVDVPRDNLTQAQYTMRVVATDGAPTPNSSERTVTFTIT